MKKENDGYEYKNIIVSNNLKSVYVDNYNLLGWIEYTSKDNNNSVRPEYTTVKLKRKIGHFDNEKISLYERKVDVLLKDISFLENKKVSLAVVLALVVGVFGALLITAGILLYINFNSLLLIIILVVLGGIFCLSSYFVYKEVRVRKTALIEPIIASTIIELNSTIGVIRNEIILEEEKNK